MLKVNDTISVKPGTEDPDFSSDIGGWQGRITVIDISDLEICWSPAIGLLHENQNKCRT